MKFYTDISQSKKLAEILPLESADMEYLLEHWIDEKTGRHKEEYYEIPVVKVDDDCPLQQITLPCWSLAALLEAIPKCIGDYNIFRMDINDIDTSMWYDKIGYGVCNELSDITIKEPVDACVAMIEKLHEQKIL